MNSDLKFILLVIGLPFLGLIYCGLGIAAMATNEVIRNHPIVSGGIFFIVPFSIAATIWIRASAKAYRN
jgi:hypothetical protein